MTHRGGAPKWEIRKDDSAPSKPNVLAQVSNDATRDRFPIVVLDQPPFSNGEASVKFKPISGGQNQAGGLVWRYQDENNYYLVRADAVENNIVLFKVESGKRVSLSPKGKPANTFGVNHPIPSKAWSILRVVFRGPKFTVYFDRRRVIEAEDSTFTGPGKIGLWTKADSVTYFDDFHYAQK